jgi:prefoldin subunit 5
MAFDKIIISSLVSAAKSSKKLESSIDNVKDNITNKIFKKVKDSIPVELPITDFDSINKTTLLSPQKLSQTQPIPNSTKPKIESILDETESSLNKSIQIKNQLQSSISSIRQPLNSVERISNNLTPLVSIIKGAVTTIKALPIPTSVPPGVGIPVNVINGFSDALDTLGDLIKKFEGSLEVIPQSLEQIRNLLNPIIEKLNSLDKIFEKITTLITFIRILLKYGPNASSNQISNLEQSVSNSILGSLDQPLQQEDSPGGDNNKDLSNRLKPNSNNPVFYRGFKLEIQFDPENTFSFPSRRIKAVNPDTNQVVYNTEEKMYSFSSSAEILKKETEFRIDSEGVSVSNQQTRTSINTTV